MASFGCKNDIFQTALMGWIAIVLLLSGCTADQDAGAGNDPVVASGHLFSGNETQEFNGGFLSKGSRTFPSEMEDPPTLDFYIMHIDRCDSDERFDQYQCIDIEQPAKEGMLMVSGDADIDFQYIKINANDEAAAYFNKLDMVSIAYSWKTATQGRYYECYAQDDHLDYTFQPLNDTANQHDVVFSGSFRCQFCNENWIAEENRWTCVPEANANPEERVYASGTLRAPMVTPQDVGAGFTKQLDLFLTININFLNQLLPR